MILQEKRILCSIKEPDRNHLWLRPKLNQDGYDLLYYGAKGWTLLINCKCNSIIEESNLDGAIQGDTLVSIPSNCPNKDSSTRDSFIQSQAPCKCNNQ